MNLFLTLIGRSLLTFWRTHAGTVAAAAVASAVIIGALATGDSIRVSLDKKAQERIGQADLALVGSQGLFRDALAADLQNALGENAQVSPILQTQAAASLRDGSLRANQVRIYGITENLAALAPQGEFPFEFLQNRRGPQQALVNDVLADRLNLEAPGNTLESGTPLSLRLRPLNALSGDAPLGEEAESPIPLRLETARVLEPGQFGRFALGIAPSPPPSVFLPLDKLQQSLDQQGKANLLLARGINQTQFETALAEVATLEDLSLRLEDLDNSDHWEIQSDQIFLSPQIVRSIRDAYPRAQPILTYLVNSLETADAATPYSMVSAVDPTSVEFLPDDMAPGQIVINQWLADDLGADVGDALRVTYFVVNAAGALNETSTEFTITKILPMHGASADPEWMPNFPGLSDADNCREWETSLPIDLDLIRDKDEEYWDDYRGTPKAFVTLGRGQEMWDNRWGKVTQMRLAGDLEESAIRETLRQVITPGDAGLIVQNLEEQAQKASQSPVSFAGLAGGFGFFLILAALALVGLLFALNLEGRAAQVGILLAQGWRTGQVRAFYLAEGAVLAILGALLGVLPGLWYAQGMLVGLRNLWPTSGGGLDLQFAVSTGSIIGGIFAGILLPLLAIGWMILKLGKVPARDLLAGSSPFETSSDPQKAVRHARHWLIAGFVALIGGLAAIGWAFLAPFQPGSFFTGSFLLTTAGLVLFRWFLAKRLLEADSAAHDATDLGRRGAALRPGRALVIAGTLAAGLFLVLASGSFRKYATGDQLDPTATGGFNLLATTTAPIKDDLTRSLPDKLREQTSLIPLRVREGDDASCLNLSSAQAPQLLGVDPAVMSGHFAFASTIQDPPDPANPWTILNQDLGPQTVPVVIDQNTLVWALKKGLGDEVAIQDEAGNALRLRFVGSLKTGVLQGNLILAEDQLVAHFPSLEGHKMFLINTPPDQAQDVIERLNRAWGNYGLAARPIAERLQAFNSVENAYITIFQVLGGMGLVLATAGIGVVAARNLLERRSALALLQAIGWNPGQIRALARSEILFPAVAGFGIGVIAAALAVWPQLVNRGMSLGWVGWMFQIVLALFVALCTWAFILLAVRSALNALSYNDLRNE